MASSSSAHRGFKRQANGMHFPPITMDKDTILLLLIVLSTSIVMIALVLTNKQPVIYIDTNTRVCRDGPVTQTLRLEDEAAPTKAHNCGGDADE
ncbi:hypothetical protein BV22DRAFT_1032371 [Leucogyrophana mollusca]|uniref:Uncharacterized protein n=1 Tax=Leucogyrophana mollusca TaxID=85980 RepID=A0ACB8BLW5_9AGAM|nr:hypothetical protein BV22DRAFT_1032371 [Leucogyrophana mollusca]